MPKEVQSIETILKKKFVSPRELVALGIFASERSIYNAVSKGTLAVPAIKFQNQLRFNLSEVLAAMERLTIPPLTPGRVLKKRAKEEEAPLPSRGKVLTAEEHKARQGQLISYKVKELPREPIVATVKVYDATVNPVKKEKKKKATK